MVDFLVTPVESCRVVAGGEQQTLDPVPARGLEHVVATDDIGTQDILPGPFKRKSGQMHDLIDAFGRTQHVGEFRNIAARGFFAGRKRRYRLDVRQPQLVFARQFPAQMTAKIADCARDQNGFHRFFSSVK